MPKIRVVTWNIAEGTKERELDQMDCLNAISGCLADSNPDIVLLNEVCVWNAHTYGGVNQITWLAQRGGYDYVHWSKTATLPRQGAKFVVVLSRIPLLSAKRIEHSAYADGGGYATLHVTANINDRKHHIFSTRLTAHDVAENIRSHETLRDMIAAIPLNEAVILGGDFNTGALGDHNWVASRRTMDFNEFATATQTRHVLDGVAWTNEGFILNGRRVWEIDHLFVRGAYAITGDRVANPTEPNPSNHPWVIADLTPLEIETVSPVTAVPPREDEILVVGIAKQEQSGRLMYAHWAPLSGWRGWTPFTVEYGTAQGFVSLALEDDRCYLLWVGPDGWVYHRARARDGQWQSIWPVGNSVNAPLNGVPGGAVHGVSCQPGMLHVFYSNAQGRILFARRDTAGGGRWPEHSGLSGGVTSAGGHVTAVSRRLGCLDAFCVGTDKGVYTSSWSVGGDWTAWTRIGAVTAVPGNYVSAVSRNTDKIDIFVVDLLGQTMSAAWEPVQGWRGWSHIQNGMTVPTGLVTAVSAGPDLLSIFTPGIEGRVCTAAWSPTGGWGGWWWINEARTIGPIWSVSRSRDKLDIFFTAPDGHIQTAAWPVDGKWGGPWVISERWE